MKHYMAVVVGLALASFAAPTLAGDGFVRLEAGRSDVNLSVEDFGEASDSDTTFGFRGGYWFNPNFAAEAFYSRLYSTTVDDGFDRYGVKLHSVGIGVAAKKNFGTAAHQGFFVGGRVGAARGVITVELDGEVEEAEASSTKPYFGIGAGYDFSQKFGVSLNYDRLKGDGDGIEVDVDTLTLGLEARF